MGTHFGSTPTRETKKTTQLSQPLCAEIQTDVLLCSGEPFCVAQPGRWRGMGGPDLLGVEILPLRRVALFSLATGLGL